ncbi:MAG: hypothetical protein E6R03_08145 [Hyphomicrobiaceae bacterium]|nr:MAG: hypothetical protein E6R03_08145 [Hyphomicrobiaceae bacterium]
MMVKATYEKAMRERVYPAEGGYTNHPKDPGGATNYGITIIDARKYWKANATVDDMRKLPKSVADQIYWKHYAEPVEYNMQPAGYDFSLLDLAINSGIGRAKQFAQRQLGSGPMFAIAERANKAPDKRKLIKELWAMRMSFLRGLSTFSVFGKGWTTRCVQGEAWALAAWMQYGEKLAPSGVKVELEKEGKDATTAAKTNAGGAVVTGSAGGTGAAVDVSYDWIVWTFIGVGVVVLVGLFVYKTYVHSARAKAFKEIGEQING